MIKKYFYGQSSNNSKTSPAMDLTKESIAEWFGRVYPESKILKLDMASGVEFNLVVRCWHGNIPMEKFCKLFIERFSTFTLTNWTVSSTFPNVRRMLFRKDYVCHLSGGNKKPGNMGSKRNKLCSASVALRFKKMTRNTCKNDRLLLDELNVDIKIRFKHSHSIRTLESYSLLRCTQRTKERYIEFFNMGILSLEAKIFNEIYLRLAYYDPLEREIQLANGMVNVNIQKLRHLHYDWKRENRDFKFESFDRLNQEKETFESLGFYLKIVQNPKIIVILTPLTKKVFKDHGEEIFIDSSGVAGKEIQYVTSVFVPTEVGALPIGYIIHDGHTEQEYEEGFKVLASSLSEFCDKPLRPKVVMTNDGEQLEELGRFFPTCTIELCPSANFTKFWTFIWDADNNIHEEDRKRLMTKYYQIVTSQSAIEHEDLFSEVMSDPKFNTNSSLVELLNRLWSIKENCYKIKTESMNEGNILTSTHMRVYREIVVRKIQKFNAYAIVKLLTEVMEGMYKRYLMGFCEKGTARCPLFAVFYDKPVSYNILPVGQNEYMVQSLTELDQVCTVYTDIIYCTCSNPTDGRNGAYCVHLCAVEFEFPFLPYPNIDEDKREYYSFPELRDEVVKAKEYFEQIDDDVSFERKPRAPKVKPESFSARVRKLEAKLKEERAISSDRSEFNDEMETSDHIDDNEVMESSEHMEDNEVIDDRDQSENEEDTIPLIIKSEPKSRKRIKYINKLKMNDIEIDEYQDEAKHTPTTSKLKRPSLKSTSEEESDIISKSWGLVYRGLSKKQKIYAKKAIDDILFEATLGTLNRNSVIINHSMQNFEIDPIYIKNESE